VRTVAAYAWAFVGVALAVVALSYAIARLYVVVLPVIVAFFLAALLGGPAGWLRRRGLPSWAATVLVLALFALVLIGLAIFVEQRVVGQFAAVDFGVRGGLDRLEQLFAGLQIVSSEQIAEAVASARDQFLSAPAPPGGERPNALLTGATTGFTVFAGTLLAAFVLFFFLLEGERLWRAFVDVWPARRRADVDAIGRRAWGALQAYLRGITLVALFNSVMLGLALAVIGVPLVYSLSIVMFLATFIPVVGSYLAGAVAALIALVFKDATDAWSSSARWSSSSRSRGTCSIRWWSGAGFACTPWSSCWPSASGRPSRASPEPSWPSPWRPWSPPPRRISAPAVLRRPRALAAESS